MQAPVERPAVRICQHREVLPDSRLNRCTNKLAGQQLKWCPKHTEEMRCQQVSASQRKWREEHPDLYARRNPRYQLMHRLRNGSVIREDTFFSRLFIPRVQFSLPEKLLSRLRVETTVIPQGYSMFSFRAYTPNDRRAFTFEGG
jgi:hypothetical protein